MQIVSLVKINQYLYVRTEFSIIFTRKFICIYVPNPFPPVGHGFKILSNIVVNLCISIPTRIL